jgi:thiamine-phosphate pyrophosphorylase
MLIVAVADVTDRRAAIAAALTAGVDAIQLRDRRASGGALLAAATTLRDLTRAHGTLLLVNDRIDVARATGADGIHLPAGSFPIAEARRLLAPAARGLAGGAQLVGQSTHAPDEARAAAAAGADYVVLGPIFATPSKAAFGAPLGLAALRATAITCPLIAIGGIDVGTIASAIDAGATGVAVIRAILDAPDPGAAAAALRAALD